MGRTPGPCAQGYRLPERRLACYLGSGREPWLLQVRDAMGTLVGLVPLQLERYGIWPLRLRMLRWLGYGTGGLTDTLGPLFAAGYEEVAMQMALDHLFQHEQEWDLLELARTPDRFVPVLQSQAQRAGYQIAIFEPIDWLYIHLPADWATLQRTLSKNLRSNLPRYRNRLHREGHRESFMLLTEPEAITAALPRFFELHRLRSRARNMKWHGNYYATAVSRAFTTEVARVLSAQGRLALAQMVVDDTVVAAQLLLFQGQTMSTYFSGFDPAWGRYSVMMLLTRACVEYAILRGMRWIDLTAGAGSQAKRQWGNEEALTYRVQITRPALLPCLAAQAIRKWYDRRRRWAEQQAQKSQRPSGPAEQDIKSEEA
jgi:CelD/BcsL family acetyltransferase involved in cellulose biosynthesis